MIPTQESPLPIQTNTPTPKKPKVLFVLVLLIVLVAVGAAAYFFTKPDPKPTTAPAVQNGSATLSLTPDSTKAEKGKTFTLTVWEDSGDQSVNVIQANLSYPVDKFDFQSIDSTDSVFDIQAQATGGEGKIGIARAQAAGVLGKHAVAKINLIAKTDSGEGEINFVEESAVIRSADSTNILGKTSGSKITIEATN